MIDRAQRQIVPLFIIAAVVEWVTRLIVQDAWPHWSQLFAPLLQAALWPLVGALLKNEQDVTLFEKLVFMNQRNR